MQHFKYSSIIDAPVEVVWEFHTRPDILQVLTPPWQPVEILRREGGLEIGAISEFKIGFGLISARWVSVHTEYKPYELFTDEQQEGIVKTWVHRHQFVSEEGHTRLTDAIAFSLPGGILAEKTLGNWVNSRLQDMFDYRHQVTKKECESLSRE